MRGVYMLLGRVVKGQQLEPPAANVRKWNKNPPAWFMEKGKQPKHVSEYFAEAGMEHESTDADDDMDVGDESPEPGKEATAGSELALAGNDDGDEAIGMRKHYSDVEKITFECMRLALVRSNPGAGAAAVLVMAMHQAKKHLPTMFKKSTRVETFARFEASLKASAELAEKKKTKAAAARKPTAKP